MRGFVAEFDCTHGWTDGDGDAACPKCAAKGRAVAHLAERWNHLTAQIEMRQWGTSREQRDDYADYLSDSIGEEAWSIVSRKVREEGEKASSTGDTRPVVSSDEYKRLIAIEEDKLWEKQHRKEREPYEEREAIEEMMGELGARMMRPYEHWNEEEAYMQYMENRRSSYDDDYDY